MSEKRDMLSENPTTRMFAVQTLNVEGWKVEGWKVGRLKVGRLNVKVVLY
jgi:hypothetical protein